jgi:hypothetical protein
LAAGSLNCAPEPGKNHIIISNLAEKLSNSLNRVRRPNSLKLSGFWNL